MHKPIGIFLVLILFISCGSKVRLVGFDEDGWKNDLQGCTGQRLALYEDLLDRQAELIGMSTTEIAQTLGKPDRIDLYKRSQKFMVYYITPTEACDNYVAGEPAKYLTVKVNAMGRAKELILYD
jgi:hypothetical protein